MGEQPQRFGPEAQGKNPGGCETAGATRGYLLSRDVFEANVRNLFEGHVDQRVCIEPPEISTSKGEINECFAIIAGLSRGPASIR